MSMVKISARRIIKYCEEGIAQHKEWDEGDNHINPYLPWINTEHKNEEKFRIEVLLLMAKEVDQGSYPYVLLSLDDFCALKRYM